MSITTAMRTPLETIKKSGLDWVNENVIKSGLKMTEAGSINFLLYGSTPSRQSVNIKFGKFGEFLPMEIIKSVDGLDLLKCGLHSIEETRKRDIDLLWADHERKIIFCREAKGNLELDTEKLPATFEKITKELQPYILEKYPEYKIDVGILNWSVYERNELKKCVNHVKKCENNGVKVEHFHDFLKTVGFDWPKDDYYDYCRNIGKHVDKILFSKDLKDTNDLLLKENEELKQKLLLCEKTN